MGDDKPDEPQKRDDDRLDTPPTDPAHSDADTQSQRNAEDESPS